MLLMRGLTRALAVALFAAAFTPGAATAQTVAPTPDQMQLLRNLTPQQQDAIKKRLTGSTNGTSDSKDTDTRQLEQQQRQATPKDLFTPMELERLERERLYLKAGDSVIIEIDFQLLPSTLPTTAPPTVGNPQPATALPPAATVLQGQIPQQRTQATQPSVQLFPEPEMTEEEHDELQKLIDLIRSRNPYKLTDQGALQLPGFDDIPLAGLSQDQATLRLQLESAFRRLQIRLTRLPLEKQGTEALKPFGYDLFDDAPSTFAPVTDVPVPADYILGAGDQLAVQLYGNDNRTVVLTVDRDGSVDFPQLGPVRVAGMRFTDAKREIEARVQRQLIGLQANVSMSDTRSIRIFVAGEANRPGSYTISGLGTIVSALYAAGGVKPIGSLRTIQLKRRGQLVTTLDLYDLMLHGDTSADAKLLPGDVVFIPPVGPTATVFGEVQRPAIYELRGEKTVQELIGLAGGLTSQADASKASLTQIDEQRRRRVVEVGLASGQGTSPLLRNGDLLQVARLRPTLDSGVTVQGYVFAPGTVAFRQGLRLSDVIRSVDELKPNADLHYLMIRRENPQDRQVSVVSADLAQALAAPGSAADVLLAARDRITVFDLQTGRDRIVHPLLDELRLQASLGRPTEVVRVDGRTKVPGEYPLEPGMTVSDLIRAGGGLPDAAYGGKAELSRYTVVNGEARRTELLEIDLASVLRGDPQANVVLKSFDSLSIREVQEWGEQELISLSGEVRFPGKYSIQRGETLKSVIARAGGLTDYGFAEGSVFTRTELKEREQKQLDTLASRLQNDLATLALQGAAANQAQAGTALNVGQSLLSQLRSSKAVGRLVIDLPRAMRANDGSPADILLRDGDSLIVPRRPQEVTVIGEVQNATSHLYRPELSRDDYVGLSGGATHKADRGNIYVVRADGSVIANGGNRWFQRSGSFEIKPGDTVVVPFDTERLPRLPFWQSVTQILYNLAIAATAINRF